MSTRHSSGFQNVSFSLSKHNYIITHADRSPTQSSPLIFQEHNARCSVTKLGLFLNTPRDLSWLIYISGFSLLSPVLVNKYPDIVKDDHSLRIKVNN